MKYIILSSADQEAKRAASAARGGRPGHLRDGEEAGDGISDGGVQRYHP